MATENLTVEQRNVRTASFDIKNRILTIPILDKNISGHLYDLLTGHEVGHALYTHEEDFRKGLELKLSSSVLNVIEDARIERKIKNKYPGLRNSFIRGYKELIEKDFFGTSGVDLNDLNFIDRVNLYTKGGAAQGINFSTKEKLLVKRIEESETYDDVINIAKDVGEYMREEEEERRKKSGPEDEIEESYEDEWSDEYEEHSNYDEDGDSDFDNKNSSGDLDNDGNQGNNQNNHDGEDGDSGGDDANFGAGTKGKTLPKEPKSFTDEAFRKNEEKLFANNDRAFYYGNIPDIDLNQAIINYRELWKNYRNEVKQKQINWCEPNFSGTDLEKFLKIRNDSKKVVSYLVKEFEMRKNAEQQKRSSISKTGELNMSKLFSYKFNEDLFKKMTIVPDGKSHGLVMFLDWSGSMTNHIENTIKQLISLTLFCKKINVPFEVYAFTSEFNDSYKPNAKKGDMILSHFKLMNLLSSKMSAAEYTYACSVLVNIRYDRPHQNWLPNWMCFGGTPLTEATISAMKIVPEFQKQYKLQIVNTVFLTDGEGACVNDVWEVERPYHRSRPVLVIRDPISKHEEQVENLYHGKDLSSAYVKLLKYRTNSNIVGFYILAGREFSSVANRFYPSSANFANIKSDFRSNKYAIVTSAGFDEYYLLRSEGLDTDDEIEFVVKENATTRGLVSAFSKYTNNRISNRVVLNRFIGMIA